jgi:uncharacterized protein
MAVVGSACEETVTRPYGGPKNLRYDVGAVASSARCSWFRRPTAAIAAAAIPLLILALRAEPLDSIPNPRTRDGSWVTDMPGALRPETIGRLNAAIAEVERTSGVEMAVVVIKSLDGRSIEEFAVKLFELWGIGKKNKDNGLLFLWSPADRRVRVEVGYGLEGALPDGKVGAILDTYVIPRFKAGEFDQGVLDGVDALLRVARNEPIELASAKSESYDSRGWGIGSVLLGGFGSLAAAIGSITGFRRWRRYRRRRCAECRTRMVRLSETEDDALLDEGKRAEERIGSVDYDVWKCPQCSNSLTLRYPKWMTGYAKCPQCHNRTKSSTETVRKAATTTSTGSARVVEECAFCSYRHAYNKVLARIQSSSGSSSSGGSSSSSSSSFGGGSSGGGGATRGY